MLTVDRVIRMLPTKPHSTDLANSQSIGQIISTNNNLTPEQVEAIINHQKAHGTRFGESAVALGLARREDVVWALSKQFDYPYSPGIISEELQSALRPFGKQAEAIRTLRSQIVEATSSGEKNTRAISIVSACVGDGKSYISANLAIALAQLGGQVALIDADLRAPRLHEVFDLKEQGNGLSNILANRGDFSLCVPLPSFPNLFVLPAGVAPPNPSELVQRPAFADLMKLLLNRFDYVIVDTPAAQHGADARTIAQICQNAVVVARTGHTHTRDLDKLITDLRGVRGLSLVGMVLNEH